MSVIDEYFKTVDEPQRQELERVRQIVRQIVPEADEVITYAMPGFKYKGKYLISFAAFKDHLSIFPGSEAIEAVKSELGNYKVSKGTIQFTVQNPLSEELIQTIVNNRKAAID